MFCDVALQNIGLIILGKACASDPVLNDKSTWYWHDFNVNENSQNWAEFKFDALHIGYVSPGDLNAGLKLIITQVKDKLYQFALEYPKQMVAGTLRLYMSLAAEEKSPLTVETKINMWLMFIRHITKD